MQLTFPYSATYSGIYEARAKSLRSSIFHYTKFDTLLKMASGGSLHATDYRFLNDYKEFIDAQECLAESSTLAKVAEFYSASKLLEILKVNLFERSLVSYVVSFSENNDQLSQWRGYCPDGGVSIGFDFEKMVALEKTSKNYLLGPCVYTASDKRKIIEELIYSCKGDVSLFIDLFVKVGSFFKDAAFEEEKEWRLVVKSVSPEWQIEDNSVNELDSIELKSSASTLIPYYVIKPVSLMNVSQVVISPLSNFNQAEYALKLFSCKHGLKFKISQSGCPFRVK